VVKIEKGIEDDGGDNKIPSTIQILKLIWLFYDFIHKNRVFGGYL
jgi:hypothetical protein